MHLKTTENCHPGHPSVTAILVKQKLPEKWEYWKFGRLLQGDYK